MPAVSVEAKARKRQNQKEKRRQQAIERSKNLTGNLSRVRTGTPEYRRAIQAKYPMPAGMTKGDIRRMMEQAAANTAAMPVDGM